MLQRFSTFLYAIGPADPALPVKIGSTPKLVKHYREACTNSPIGLEIIGKVRAPPEWADSVRARLAPDRLHGWWFTRSERVKSLLWALNTEDPIAVSEWMNAHAITANQTLANRRLSIQNI